MCERLHDARERHQDGGEDVGGLTFDAAAQRHLNAKKHKRERTPTVSVAPRRRAVDSRPPAGSAATRWRRRRAAGVMSPAVCPRAFELPGACWW